MINDEVLDLARQNLGNRFAAVDNARLADVFHRDFSFEQIIAGVEAAQVRGWITPLLGEDIECAAIYRLTVNDQDGANRLKLAFEEYVPPDGVKLARYNEVTESRTVYVGSSRTIRNRLPQHLNNCAAGTYALKMRQWCPKAENSLRVEVTVVRGELDAALVQDLEDALWKNSRPMFGKFGAR
ncbi:MAG: GIY-YIG nuclease family protein [Albidovulum sp.]